jgi:pimeloyl-ACP methyl ester carboxylesterase
MGPALVPLHGGLLTVEPSFGSVVSVLADHHRIIAAELQGHGRTADMDRPMASEHLATDGVSVLDHLGIKEADVFGFRLGGSRPTNCPCTTLPAHPRTIAAWQRQRDSTIWASR